MNATEARSPSGGVPPSAAPASGRHLLSLTPSPFELAVVVAITALAAVLRFHGLIAKSFWFDEGVSVAIARLDWYNFSRILWRREANMSLYYLLLRPWLQFGDSESFVRSLSVILGLAAVPALYWLARRMFDRRVGLIAAALLALHAYHIRYSQEARSYTLMALLCILSSLYFLECLDDPSPRKRTAYVLSSALAVYAHFFAGLLILSQWVSLRFLEDKTGPDRMRKSLRWFALAVGPLAVFVAATGAGPLRWIQHPGFKEFWKFALSLGGNGGATLLCACVLASGAALLPVGRGPRGWRVPWAAWRYRFLLLWLGLPVLLTLAVSALRPLFVPRYFVFCLPALLLLVACGLSRLRPNWLFGTALLVFLLLSLRGTLSYYERDFDLQRDDWRSATRSLLAQSRPGDAVIFHVAMGRMPFEYYRSKLASSSTAPYVLYPNHGDRITFLDFVEKPNLSQLQSSLPQHPRVWLVLSYAETPSGLDPTARLLEDLLAQSYEPRQQQSFPGLEIVLYQTDEPAKLHP